LYRKRPPRIMNRTVPKIIAISVHTVNRFPLIMGEMYAILIELCKKWDLFACHKGK
jgi:hypothetical protein